MNSELREIAAGLAPQPLGSLNTWQKSAVVLPTNLESVGALPGAEGGSPGIVPDEAKPSLTDRATIRRAVASILKTVAHSCLLWVLRG
jgi:hypothetical protein